MRKLGRLLFVTLVLSLPVQAAPVAAQPNYTGRVNHVYDASTVRLAYHRGGQIRVKLAAIDGPYTEQAQAALAERVLGKEIKVRGLGWKDGYLIGQVLVNGNSVCGEMIRDGNAKLADDFDHLPGLRQLEDEARRAQRGIWSKEPVASS